MRRTRTLLAVLVCVCALTGCGGQKTEAPETYASAVISAVAGDSDPLSPLWEHAKYTEDCEIGSGAHNVRIIVGIGERSVTITVRSDKTNLAEMLTESGLVEGEESSYGLYIKRVNGVLADYDTDKAFWSLQQNGTPTAVGASLITIADGDAYELVYTPADE